MTSRPPHPPQPSSGPMAKLWDRPVRELAQLPAPEASAEATERHVIYSLLVMALVAHYWNGNKRGNGGEYPWREGQRNPAGGYLGGDYLGHNIASIAVNSRGHVIDFDFNHNEIMNSSVEHAESRLVRRVFSLTQIYDLATAALSTAVVPIPYANVLNDVSVYTSLESCSQCSGIMALGSVKEVVFIQRDPGQHSIGNILRNLSPEGERYRPPLPIPANYLGLSAFDELDAAYEAFRSAVQKTPFYIPIKGKPDHSPSITSFLCTDAALAIFARAREAFTKLEELRFPDYQPAPLGYIAPGTLTNREALNHAKRFFDYAAQSGKRGTPHQL